MQLTTELAQLASERPDWAAHFDRGTELVAEGAPGEALYVVLKGRVVLSRTSGNAKQEQILRVLGVGESIGAMALLAETPYEASARALEDVDALRIETAELLAFFRIAPELGISIAQALAEQVVAAMPVTAVENDAADGSVGATTGAAVEAAAGGTEPATATQREDKPNGEAPGAPTPINILSLAPQLESGPAKKKEEKAASEAPGEGPANAKEKLSAFYGERLACPVCATKFEATRVRSGALRALRRESDLRTVYEGVNPVHYAAYVCTNCQYAAYDDDWSTPNEEELERLKADSEERRRATADYSFEGERELNTVTISYLLALRSYDLREPDTRRRAGILHRLAWSAREAKDEAGERQYLEIARKEYARAFEEDEGLSEGGALTLSYILGDLALRLSDTKEALRWFERSMRMDNIKQHPEIARLVRDRWSDARDEQKKRSA